MADVQLVEISATEGAQIINSTVEAQQPAQIVLAVPGVQGPTGNNLPASGTTHQVLFKQSNTNYDTGWKLITNDNVDGAAAIAGTKISPNFGSQTIQTTGVFSHALGTTGAPSITFTGDVNTGIYSPGADQLALSTNGTGRLFVDASGRVGIGQSVPVDSLHVVGAARFGSTNFIGIGADGSGSYLESVIGTHVLRFNTNGSERLRITSDGKVGIGMSSPSTTLDVIGNSRIRTGAKSGSNTYLNLESTDATNTMSLTFQNATNQAWIIQAVENGVAYRPIALNPSGGNVGIGTTSPGGKLQINAQDGFLFDVGAGAYSYMRFGSQNAGEGVAELANERSSAKVFLKTGLTGSTLNTRLEIDGAGATIINNQSGTERARIDSSGRLLVGTSSALNVGGNLGFEPLQVNGIGMSLPRFAAAGNGSILTFSRSLSSTTGTNTSVASGTHLGAIEFTGADGTSYPIAAQIIAAVDGTPGANDMPGRLVFSTTADGASSPTERLRITSTGNVGIGISTPNYLITANSSTAISALQFINSSTGSTASDGFLVYNNGLNAILSNEEAGDLRLQTSGQQRLTIDSSGRVGIGTTSPGATLHVEGSELRVKNGTGVPNVTIAGRDTDGTAILAFQNNGSSSSNATLTATTNTLAIATGGTERLRIDSSGRLLVGTSTARSNFFNTSTFAPGIQLEGAIDQNRILSVVGSDSGGAGGVLVLASQKSGAVGGNTIVTNNGQLGLVSFQGSDGTEFVEAARIQAEVDGTPGANDMPGRLVFSTTADGASSPTQRMTIYNNGNTGIFTTSVDSLFLDNSAAAGTTVSFLLGRYGATGLGSGTASFRVWTNGNVVNTNNSYGAISDIKLKENIADAGSQWDDIKALQVRKYNFKEGQTHTQIGLVAQEVEQVSPGLVYESPDRDEDGNDLGTVTKSVNYSVLYMKAVKALQEAMERIETLEAKVAAVETP